MIRRFAARMSVVALSLLALCLGLALGSTACLCDCPEPTLIVSGTYEILATPARPELLHGTVDVQSEGVTIMYTIEGIDWTVEYMSIY